ncbi:MAG: TonB-dependent receptor, partial [Saprospiraceae bacterium]
MLRLLFLILFAFTLSPISLSAQNCNLTLTGRVIDLGTDEPLEIVNVFIEETGKGAVTDSLGRFVINDLCAKHYHLRFTHIGCEPTEQYVELVSDTSLVVNLEHSVNMLEGVVITENTIERSTQSSKTIKEQNITDNADENLANLLGSIAGVSSLKNGNGIAKPVVHGLYGNRLTILNNGIAQSGQQWGNDHSPEIDPLVANKIRVIKGVSALSYAGANLGGIVLVEPAAIGREPHLHGRAKYFYETNGQTHGANLQIQQYTPVLAWKINGTFKRGGDKQAANYFLKNTGTQEANLALQLEKKFSDRLFTNLYASTFNTELGVLRGSHVGNLTDLQTAFERETPFFTEDEFTYAINAPKQLVNHQLLKLQGKYFINDHNFFVFFSAGQLNNRQEFDVRRSGRSDIPALKLQQWTYFAEAKYQADLHHQSQLKTGIQINIIDNKNDSETGILPLIPDYLAYETAAFVVWNKTVQRSFFELGARYDNVLQKVAAISTDLPRRIVRYSNLYHNLSSSAGWTYQFSKRLQLATNLGLATRNPAINELYSGGLHQGVSGIEEGSVDLQPESSIKTTLALNGKIRSWLSFESLIYHQNINDYIYLQPQDEIRLTIRGAFPVFKYEQTNAQIYGLDLSTDLQLTQA